jgi:ATP-dependent DNA ligase
VPPKERRQTPKKHCGAYIPSMLIERMRKRLAIDRASFIEPCLPSPAEKPPSGSNWIHEIKHDGFRLMARRDPVGIRLITRSGNDRPAFPLLTRPVLYLPSHFLARRVSSITLISSWAATWSHL